MFLRGFLLKVSQGRRKGSFLRWKNPRKAVQPFENKKRKIDIFKNYEANGVEKIQRKLEIFSTLISKKSSQDTRL